VAAYLKKNGIDAHEIHGDMPQGKRNQIMERLRDGKLEVLAASDLAARGLDVEGITHVINYDLPEDPEIYVHRIGRTARAGRSGAAWTFVEPGQGQLLTEVEKLTGVLMDRLEFEGFEPPAIAEAGPHPRAEPETPGQALKRRAAAEPPPEPDPEKFPGGGVPQGQRRRSLGGRIKRRRR
jgi:ATP-dependent RNA helicase RhlE